MEGKHKTPPTALRRQTSSIKSRRRPAMRSFSNSSYPQIPSRRSSLSMTTGYDSSDLATSTRTPSLSDSLNKIDVVKIRQEHTKPDIRKSGLDASEDPFVEHKYPNRAIPRVGLMTRSGYQLVPQLLVRWSSGSYRSIEPCLSSDMVSSSDGTGQLNSHQDSRPDSDPLCPLELPVAFASMRSCAGRPYMNADSSMSVWTSVNITADVSPISLRESTKLAPLDMIILFDSLQQPSVSLLTPVVVASSVLTSNLVLNHDRLAIACVDGGANSGFELLLPLGFHSFGTIRIALNTFSLRQLKKKRRIGSNLGHSLRQISQLFSPSSRAAFGHLVLVSANSPKDTLFISGVDPAIGFHTISPQLTFPLNTTNHPLGWHIFYDADADDPRSLESHFMRKVSKVVRQLRTGINPGCISNLELGVNHGPGCKFESAVECCKLNRLRPGETWVLKTKIGTPVKFYQETHLTQHPIIQDLIGQINEVIRMYSSEPVAQHVLTAHLKYYHSLLPPLHAICLETHCTISRTPFSSFPSLSEQKDSALMLYEQDDDAISISMESASESN